MDKNQLKEFMNAIGAVAETTLIFYRSIIKAGGTQEEGMRLTQALIAATIFGEKHGQENRGGVTNEHDRRMEYPALHSQRRNWIFSYLGALFKAPSCKSTCWWRTCWAV